MISKLYVFVFKYFFKHAHVAPNACILNIFYQILKTTFINVLYRIIRIVIVSANDT